MLLATDLDRTLLPNGVQEYDGSMDILKQFLKSTDLKLAFVTGRHLNLVKQAMEEYKTPKPDYIIASVGTRLYNGFNEDEGYTAQVKKSIECWDVEIFRQKLSVLEGIRLQEPDKQNNLKLSYYTTPGSDAEKEVKRIIAGICSDAAVVYSVDEAHGVGLLDILPKHATKLAALEYLRKKLKLNKDEVIYCGDSGNDLLPLTFGYKSIVVRNATAEVRESVRQLAKEKKTLGNIYFAKGNRKLNGYYVSGIIQGLLHYKIVRSDSLK